MTTKQWYRAHLRWAVMVEGKEGLRGWKDSVYLFLSDDHDTAFRRALEIGRCQQDEHQEGRRWVETRLADIVTLDNLGSKSFGRHRAALQPRPASLRTNDVGGQIR